MSVFKEIEFLCLVRNLERNRRFMFMCFFVFFLEPVQTCSLCRESLLGSSKLCMKPRGAIWIKSGVKGARRISLDPMLNTRLAHPWAEMWQKAVFAGSKGRTFCRNMVYSRHYIGTLYLYSACCKPYFCRRSTP